MSPVSEALGILVTLAGLAYTRNVSPSTVDRCSTSAIHCAAVGGDLSRNVFVTH